MKNVKNLSLVVFVLLAACLAVVSAGKNAGVNLSLAQKEEQQEKPGENIEENIEQNVEENIFVPKDKEVSSISSDPALAKLYPGDGKKTVEAFALKNGLSVSDYPESLIDLLSRNSETKDFVLSYPTEHDAPHTIDLSDCVNTGEVPLLMQWDKRWGYITYGADVAALTACGPVCLSMVALYVTGNADLSPDKIMEFAVEEGYCVYGNGSAWTLISEGGEKLGMDVNVLPLDENRIIENLEAGNPVICVMGPGLFTTTGHFIVLTDYVDGKFKVNDPNSYERSQMLWDYDDIYDQIQNLWAIR